MRTSVLPASLLVLLAACAEPPTAPPDDDGPLPDDAVFTETVVELSPTGSQVVSTRPLTVGEARRDNARRAERSARPELANIAADPGCSVAALWLYDRADGTGNRICFRGAGLTYLGWYWRYADGAWHTWAIGVGMVWSGESPGRLVGDTHTGSIDASPDSLPYQQTFPFPAWSAPTPVYGLVPYHELILDSPL